MRRLPGLKRIASLFAGAALVCWCFTAGAPARAQGLAPTGTIWMISGRSLARLEAQPGTKPLVREFFASSSDSVIVDGAPDASSTGLAAQRALSFASYQTMRERLAAPDVPHLVVLDLERWPQTPAIEQGNVALYYRLAGELAHRDGLALVATPSPNLVRTHAPRPWPSFTAYLESGLIGQIAKHADVFEVQAQDFERSTALYADFVATAADQARLANPNIIVIAGLSTNPGGRPVPAAQLYRDVAAARGHVQGFWLNIPARSLACPRCGIPHPGIAAGLLQRLSRESLPAVPAPAIPAHACSRFLLASGRAPTVPAGPQCPLRRLRCGSTQARLPW